MFDIAAREIIDDIKMLLFTELSGRHACPCVLLQKPFHVNDDLTVRKNKPVVVSC